MKLEDDLSESGVVFGVGRVINQEREKKGEEAVVAVILGE